jgi:hypothetical protein
VSLCAARHGGLTLATLIAVRDADGVGSDSPVVAQKPIRSQRMLIRDRDSRPCSEICPFSESGHLKATISTESRIWAALRNGWKETDLAEATARSTIAVGSGRATFVPMMESTDLGKCDDLAS